MIKKGLHNAYNALTVIRDNMGRVGRGPGVDGWMPQASGENHSGQCQDISAL